MSSLNCDDTASIVTTSGIMSSKFRNLRLLDKVLLSVIVVLSIIVLALIISVGVQGSKLRYLEQQEASPLRATTVKSGTVRPDETTTPPPSPTPKGPAPPSPRPLTSSPYTAKPPHPPHPEPCVEPECVNVCLDPECVETAGGMLKTMAKHVNPCDDFYEYACGQWGDVNLIPDSAYSWNQFEMSRELVSRAVNELLMHDHEIELRPEPLQDAKKFYDDCIHQNNENNYTQLKEFIEHMLVDFHKDLGTTLGRLRRNLGANYLFTLKVDTNSKDTSKNTIFLDQPDFAIPRSILTSNNFMHDNEVHSYSALIIESWGAVFGVSHTAAAEIAANVLHFERSLALATTSPVHRMNQSELHNVYTIEELYVLTESEGKHLSWDDFFEEVFAEIYDPVSHASSWNKTTLIVRDVHFFHMIENILNSNDTAHILHDYLAWRIIYEMIQDVSEELRDFYFNFELATQEMESPLPMWRMCAGQTQHHFGMALTYYFVEEYFDEDLKFLVQEIIDEIKKTLKSALAGTSTPIKDIE